MKWLNLNWIEWKLFIRTVTRMSMMSSFDLVQVKGRSILQDQLVQWRGVQNVECGLDDDGID